MGVYQHHFHDSERLPTTPRRVLRTLSNTRCLCPSVFECLPSTPTYQRWYSKGLQLTKYTSQLNPAAERFVCRPTQGPNPRAVQRWPQNGTVLQSTFLQFTKILARFHVPRRIVDSRSYLGMDVLAIRRRISIRVRVISKPPNPNPPSSPTTYRRS